MSDPLLLLLDAGLGALLSLLTLDLREQITRKSLRLQVLSS